MFERRRFLKLSAAIAALGLPALGLGAEKPLRLGTLPVISIRTAYEIYRPLMDHLEKSLALPPILLEVPPNFKGMYQRIQDNGFDLLISPPHIARLAQKKLGWHPLVLFQPEHQSVLLVPETDGPNSIEALRGGTIAVLDNSALVAIVMMDALAKKGLQADRDFKVIETRSYESSQIAVKQGVAQAMVFRSQGFIAADARDRFKVIFEAGVLPSYVIIAAPEMSKARQLQLRNQLLAFGKKKEARPFMEKLGYDSLTGASEEAMRRLDPYLDETEAKLR